MSGPTTLNVYLTRRCTSRCVWCTGRGQVQTEKDISVELVEKTLSMFPTIQGVCLAGLGEPLLFNELPEMLEMCLSRGLFVGLITNGHMITDWDGLIDFTRFGYVNVSVNSIDPEEYRAVCGVDRLGDVIKGIEYLVAYNANVQTSFVTSASNIDKAQGWIDWSRALGVKTVVVHNMLPGLHQSRESFMTNVLTEAHRGVVAALNGSGITLHRPVLVGSDGALCPATCRSPFDTIGVDGLGNVTGCHRV